MRKTKKKYKKFQRLLTDEYFEKMAGILNTKGKLTKSLLEERAKEKELERKKGEN